MKAVFAGALVLAMAVPVMAKEAGLVVPLKTSTGQDAGTATFTPVKDGKVKVVLDLKNVPSGEHGVHIHQNPVCDGPDFKTAGAHFNPGGKQHGYENPMGHHNGDLPKSVMVSVDGNKTTFVLSDISMGTGAANDILANGGTSLIVHEKADDEKTDPSGASGNRIACGVIK